MNATGAAALEKAHNEKVKKRIELVSSVLDFFCGYRGLGRSASRRSYLAKSVLYRCIGHDRDF
jgi:hypothetical protein